MAASQSDSASGAAGLGNLIGQLGSAYMMKPIGMRKGGIIKIGDAHGSSQAKRHEDDGTGGLSSMKRSGNSGGGLVRGPGTATSDSIAATIEGRQPIRLSNGEAVLNADAVKLLGEDFIHSVNSIAVASSKPSRARRKPETRKPQTLGKTMEQTAECGNFVGDESHV